jgi:acyl-CoA reductase-like NAD-dependent aldehyde dehydrogenase
MATFTVARGAPASAPPSPDSVVDSHRLDEIVGSVFAARDRWARTTVPERIALLERILDDTVAAAPDWVADACRAKGIPGGTPASGEEWHSGPALLARNARLLRDSLRDIERAGRPELPRPLATGPDGRVVARVFPGDAYDRLLFPGTTADVWMPPGRSADEVLARQAWAYRDPRPEPVVELVLGAGNIASLAPRDVLYSMFVENRVAVLKCNPVNDYLAPHLERALAALVEHGVLRVVNGDAATGAYLVNHPQVGHIHITGSDKTFDAVVFGPGPEGAARKARGERLVDKPVTAELGNVSPVVVVPGRWSDSDLRYHAAHVATMLAHNAGFNCIAARVIVTAAGWDQRDAFLGEVKRALAALPSRSAYYPGAADRHAAFVEQHPGAFQTGGEADGQLPLTLVGGVDPGDAADACFTTEAFCGLMAETGIEAASPADFLDRATAFCNDTLWGTLGASIIVKQARDAAVAPALERAVHDLRYGSVCVNIWQGLAYGLTTTSWGAYPGHPDSDIQSGRGVVGNTYMLEDPEKSVLRAPFRFRPRPAWFAGHKNGARTLQALTALEAHPSPKTLARAFAAALRP